MHDEDTTSEGIVYVLINEAMPGYVKIGKTTDLESRIKSLDSTGLPLPFECTYAAQVADMDFVERQVHEGFADKRVRARREFFEIEPERAVAVIRLAELKEVTPGDTIVEFEDDKSALNMVKDKKRSAFNFDKASIPQGATLTFTRDKNITCTVVDRKQVEFQGETMSVSEAARRALGREHYRPQGPIFWEYKEETLDERRRRIEERDDDGDDGQD